MSNYVQESYKPVQITGTGTFINSSNGVGGFLCITGGTISIVTNSTPARTIVPTFTVTAGIYYPMPFTGSHDGLVVTSVSAVGVLGVH